MANILKTYKKTGIITVGDDNLKLDTPTFEIIDIRINMRTKVLEIDILHKVQQKGVTQEHTRTEIMNFNTLPNSIRTTGKSFLDAIEGEILKLPQYTGSNEQ